MPTKKPAAKKPAAKKFATIPAGTPVTWPYRGATGHGTVQGVYKRGTNAGNTEYTIREHDHHPGEKAVLHHYGRVLTRGK
jgi:hypothetical protein